jgi:NADP-dependent 3-hydroxy acid dehydrogenase YdfG
MNTINLVGKKAMVIGAAGGMGSAISVALAKEGVSCALVGRTAGTLEKVARNCEEAGTQAFPIEFDIADLDSIEVIVHNAIRVLGGLNYLINCAGIHKGGKAYEADMVAWDSQLDTNLRATYYLSRYCLPEINKTPGGAVLKIGSIAGAYTGGGMHLATTHAIEGYLKAMFEDVREIGTKVCVIRPGYVSTSMSTSDRLDSELMIQPDDIARTVLFVLSMPETTCPTDIELRPQRSPYK